MVVPVANAFAPPVAQPLWKSTPVSVQPPPRTKRTRRPRTVKNSWYHRFIVSTQDTMSNSLATTHQPRAIAPKSSNEPKSTGRVASSRSSSSSSSSSARTLLPRPSSDPNSSFSLPNQPIPHMSHLRVLLPKPPEIPPATFPSNTPIYQPTTDTPSIPRPYNPTPTPLPLECVPSTSAARPALASGSSASPSASTAAGPVPLNREESSTATNPSLNNTESAGQTVEAPSIQLVADSTISDTVPASNAYSEGTSLNRPRGKQISLPLRASIIALHERARWSFSDLEKNLGIPMSTLRHIVQRTKERAGHSASFMDLLDHLHDLPRSGRPGKRKHASDDEEPAVLNPSEGTAQSDLGDDTNEETFVPQNDRPSSSKRQVHTRTLD